MRSRGDESMMSWGGAGNECEERAALARAGGCWCCEARGAGGAGCASCRLSRLVQSLVGVELAKMRGLAGKELAASGVMLGRGRVGRARRREVRPGAAVCGHGAGGVWSGRDASTVKLHCAGHVGPEPTGCN